MAAPACRRALSAPVPWHDRSTNRCCGKGYLRGRLFSKHSLKTICCRPDRSNHIFNKLTLKPFQTERQISLARAAASPAQVNQLSASSSSRAAEASAPDQARGSRAEMLLEETEKLELQRDEGSTEQAGLGPGTAQPPGALKPSLPSPARSAAVSVFMDPVIPPEDKSRMSFNPQVSCRYMPSFISMLKVISAA